MRAFTIAGIATGILLTGGAVWRLQAGQDPTPAPELTFTIKAATPLSLGELLDPGPKLRPSAKALALNGTRVRLAGFMAEMEEPIKGGFYLVRRPMSFDESGAGTGDLPPDSVLVIVPGSERHVIPHLPGALQGAGILEVGNLTDAEGRTSKFRLRLDPDQRLSETLAMR